MSDQIKVPTCKHYDMTVAELEADGYVMEDMPLCEMCSYDEIERLQAELEQAKAERDAVADEVIKMDAENEELQSDLSVARQSLYKATEQRNQYASNNARLRDAMEKIVEALTSMTAVGPHGACKIAKKALKD